MERPHNLIRYVFAIGAVHLFVQSRMPTASAEAPTQVHAATPDTIAEDLVLIGWQPRKRVNVTKGAEAKHVARHRKTLRVRQRFIEAVFYKDWDEFIALL